MVENGRLIAQQVIRQVDTAASAAPAQRSLATTIQRDRALTNLLGSYTAFSPFVLSVAVTDPDGKVLAHSTPAFVGREGGPVHRRQRVHEARSGGPPADGVERRQRLHGDRADGARDEDHRRRARRAGQHVRAPGAGRGLPLGPAAGDDGAADRDRARGVPRQPDHRAAAQADARHRAPGRGQPRRAGRDGRGRGPGPPRVLVQHHVPAPGRGPHRARGAQPAPRRAGRRDRGRRADGRRRGPHHAGQPDRLPHPGRATRTRSSAASWPRPWARRIR